jgi:hypothetical protein
MGIKSTEAADKVSQQKPFPQHELGEQLRIVSRLIAGGLKTPVYLVRIGGFDTHDAQVVSGDHTVGEHANLLGMLDESVMAFMEDLKFQGTAEKVIGMTFSEFGRRVVSNASLGTDHGTSAPLFIFGEKSAGGITGQNPQVDAAMTYADNLSAEYDFRQIYASVLEQWFGLSNTDISGVLQRDFTTVPILGNNQLTATGELDIPDQAVSIYPNPVRNVAMLNLNNTEGGYFEVRLADLLGRTVQVLYTGQLSKGATRLHLQLDDLKPGTYVVVTRGPADNHAIRLIKR